MGRIEDLDAEMRREGLTIDEHMLYTIFIDALAAEYEVEARNPAFRVSIGRDDIKTVRERHRRRSGNSKKGSNAGHAICSPSAAAVVAAGKTAAAVAERKVETAAGATEVESNGSTDETVYAPTWTVVARPWLRGAIAQPPKPPKVLPPRCDATGEARRPLEDRLHGEAMRRMPRMGSHCRCLPRVRGEAMQPLQRTGARCSCLPLDERRSCGGGVYRRRW